MLLCVTPEEAQLLVDSLETAAAESTNKVLEERALALSRKVKAMPKFVVGQSIRWYYTWMYVPVYSSGNVVSVGDGVLAVWLSSSEPEERLTFLQLNDPDLKFVS